MDVDVADPDPLTAVSPLESPLLDLSDPGLSDLEPPPRGPLGPPEYALSPSD